MAYELDSQEGYKLGEALKKAWKDTTVKERHFITPLALYSKRPLEPWQPFAGKGKGKRARAKARQLSRGRVLPGPRITSPFASDTIPRAARREINAISPTFAPRALLSTPAISARAQLLPDRALRPKQTHRIPLQLLRPPGRVGKLALPIRTSPPGPVMLQQQPRPSRKLQQIKFFEYCMFSLVRRGSMI